jgi:hypothetical protein
MNRLWLGAILAISLGACTPNKKAPVPPEPTTCSPTSCPIKDVIQEEDWQFTLTGNGWAPIKAPAGAVKVAFINSDLNMIVFFLKEEAPTFPQYIVNYSRTLHLANAMLDSSHPVIINDSIFMLLIAHGATRNFWTWINVHKGAGYVFSCAIDDDVETDGGATSFNRCREIAETVKFQ